MYLVEGRSYEAEDSGLERALADAYETHSRPLCCCSSPPIPVYITRLGETYVLKRMPFTGSQHSVGCTHYEPPAAMSGLDEVLGSAISEDPDTGVTRLKVGFSLSRGPSRDFAQGGGKDGGVVKDDGTRFSLRGLVLFLWQEAELTKWRPAFEGKRSWAVVRARLLVAASNKVLKGLSLADTLYIPEAFSVADAEAIRARRGRCFAHVLRHQGQTRSKMILIGELKEIVPSRFHFSVVIRHLPDTAFFLSSGLHRRMVRRFEAELALWTGSAETHLVIAATFSLADWGQPMIEEVSLIPVSAEWLPLDDGFEKRLIDRLVNERRTFNKSLGFNSKLPSTSISAVLLDVLQAPVALALDRGYDSEPDPGAIPSPVCATWQWRVHTSEFPALPR